ncbi:MAG: hypothetical protein UIH27_11050 [Ruminococcus sp.]|nr:hypothetical protein [Ruminococcus sp.]
MKVREKRVVSGKLVEAEFFVIASGGRRYTRGKKKQVSRAVQQRLNDKNARKKLHRLLEANFSAEKDYYCTFTYRNSEMPQTYAECKRDINNYFKRLRRARSKARLPELKYIYVIECKVSKKTGVPRFHVHIVLNGGLPRKEIKEIWGKGDIKKVEELQEGENGFEALANYLCKEWSNAQLPADRKRYTPSRNLKQPHFPKPKDGVFSQRHLEKLCKQRIDDAPFWERRYKGCRFISAEAVYNEDYGTWALSVTMRKKE